MPGGCSSRRSQRAVTGVSRRWPPARSDATRSGVGVPQVGCPAQIVGALPACWRSVRRVGVVSVYWTALALGIVLIRAYRCLATSPRPRDGDLLSAPSGKLSRSAPHGAVWMAAAGWSLPRPGFAICAEGVAAAADAGCAVVPLRTLAVSSCSWGAASYQDRDVWAFVARAGRLRGPVAARGSREERERWARAVGAGMRGICGIRGIRGHARRGRACAADVGEWREHARVGWRAGYGRTRPGWPVPLVWVAVVSSCSVGAVRNQDRGEGEERDGEERGGRGWGREGVRGGAGGFGGSWWAIGAGRRSVGWRRGRQGRRGWLGWWGFGGDSGGGRVTRLSVGLVGGVSGFGRCRRGRCRRVR